MGVGVSSRGENPKICQAPKKLAQPFLAPELRSENYGHEAFSEYHSLQNHYTHEIIIFELFRGLHYSFRGVFELIFITVTVSLFF